MVLEGKYSSKCERCDLA